MHTFFTHKFAYILGIHNERRGEHRSRNKILQVSYLSFISFWIVYFPAPYLCFSILLFGINFLRVFISYHLVFSWIFNLTLKFQILKIFSISLIQSTKHRDIFIFLYIINIVSYYKFHINIIMIYLCINI